MLSAVRHGRHHELRGPGTGCCCATRCRRARFTSRSPASTRPTWPRGRTGGGELLCVAAVTAHKGHDVLLAALAAIADLPWRCVCVGTLDREPAFVERLRRQAEAAGIGDRVCFAGLRIGDDLASAYAAADVLVLASRAETYGMVVTEALARGLPVIATAVGGLPEALGRTSDGAPTRPAGAARRQRCAGGRAAPLADRRRSAPAPPGGGAGAAATLSGWDVPTDGSRTSSPRRRHDVADSPAASATVWAVARCWAGPRSWRSSCGGWAPARSWTDSARSTAGRWPRRPASRSSRRCARPGDGASSPAASGSAVPLRTATAAYYRSQFLNTVLPGGVLGDVDRAVRHGRDAGDVGRGLRAVAWERSAGQVVQLALALVRAPAAPVAGAAVGFRWWSRRLSWARSAAAAAEVGGRAEHHGAARTLRAPRRADLQDGLLARRAWPGIALASVVVVAGHLATLFLAARTAGATSSTLQLLPLAMLVLVAMAVPTNIGGWGPREGMAAWAFARRRPGRGQGVATATVYGVLALAAILPGAPLIAAAWLRRGRPAPRPEGGVAWLSVPTPC